MHEIDSADLVPGDIIYLKAGDKVPADARIIEQKDLKVNEASLTGEWLAISKSTKALASKTGLADRENIAHMGTIVEGGSAIAIVVETGKRTALGAVVSLLRETKERKTPLQQQISRLSRFLGLFIVLIIGLIAVLGYLTGKSLTEIFITSLALAVSAIPEGLLPAITVILALGMRRILKENGLVRKLIANETLGSVTVICTDKTGTLTEGKMQVSHILTGARELLHDGKSPLVGGKANGLESHILALKAAVLSNEAFIENPDDELNDWVVRGVPTERALLIAGAHAGLSPQELLKEYPRLDRISFSSEAKYSASLHKKLGGGKILYVIGAPEILAQRSINLHVDGKKEKLSSKTYQDLSTKLNSLTQKGLRVIACAYKEISDKEEDLGELEDQVADLTLIGYIAIKDPLRPDAKESIALTKRAGIRTILITGDHRLTALSIATEIGIEASLNTILEGQEIDKLSDEELAERVESINIYPRVSPKHKLRIVQALQNKGEVVAMVGDGVNDAPAIKAADIGVAVGSGTDVAKEVADLVLLDDNFRTIVKAIEQGRVIFQNIRKVFVYLVADDFSEIFLFLATLIFGLPLPLFAAQILWLNLIEDGFPGIALTTEQETEDVMDEKPRKQDEPILNKPLQYWMIVIFFVTGLAAFFLFIGALSYTGSLETARSITFALMCFDSILFAFSVRSFKHPVWRKNIFSNKFLNGAVLISLALLFVAFYFPPLNKLLSTQALTLNSWLLIIGISIAEIILIEIAKKKIFQKREEPAKLCYNRV